MPGRETRREILARDSAGPEPGDNGLVEGVEAAEALVVIPTGTEGIRIRGRRVGLDCGHEIHFEKFGFTAREYARDRRDREKNVQNVPFGVQGSCA